jgi:ferric-dicitrate binding protein FerR (iron transport regulator)
MSSQPLRLKYLFDKYLDNSCTRQELEEFWRLMSELSEEDLIHADLRELWHQEEASDAGERPDWDQVYSRLQQRVGRQETDYTRVASIRRRRLVQIAAAAAVIGVLVITWSLFRYYRMPRAVSSSSPVVRAMGHQVINLNDGSVVTLNSNSRLNYPVAFNSATRDVYLTGEAFFDIRHDAAKAFFVHTGSVVVKVLGTSFNIKAYPGEKDVSVTVIQGKVQIQREDNKKVLGTLSPGDQLILNKLSDTAVTVTRPDTQQILAWKTGDLLFDNTSLDEAAVLLGNHFGVELRFRNEALRHCRFTADLSEKTLEQALDIICTITRSTWKKEDQKIWLDGKGCD